MAVAGHVWSLFRALPGRGAEAGGLLLGRRGFVAGRPAVVVDAAEPIHASYANGPSFRLTAEEQRKAAARLDALAAGELAPVGVFRSDTAETPVAPDGSAAELLSLVPWHGQTLLLLVRPSRSGQMSAVLFFRNDGAILRETGPLPFPFSGPPFQVSTIAFAPAEAAARPGMRGGKPSWMRTAGLAAGVGLASLAGAASAFAMLEVLRSQANTVSSEETFGMRARRSGEQLIVEWDGATPVAQGATGGSLWVRDGNSVRQWPMTADRLRLGRLVYVPQSDAVRLSLEMDGAAGRRTRQSLIVLGAREGAETAVQGAYD